MFACVGYVKDNYVPVVVEKKEEPKVDPRTQKLREMYLKDTIRY